MDNEQSTTAKEENIASHKEEDVLRLNRLEKFLLYISKTDFTALKNFSPDIKNTQLSIGFLVLSVGILATISSSFLIHTVFFENVGFWGYPISIFFALFYASIIVALDREIVAITTKNKWTLAWRLLFAGTIGIVVSLPIELKLFAGDIENTIKATTKEKIENSQDGFNKDVIKLYKAETTRLNDEKIRIAKQMQEVDKQLNEANIKATEEIRTSPGPKYQAYSNKAKELATAKDKLQKEFDSQKIDEILERDYHAVSAKIEEEKKIAEEISNDLLSRYKAYKKASEGQEAFTWFIKIFLILLDCMPVLVKFNMPRNEYQAYLEKRTALNIFKIESGFEQAKEQIKTDPLSTVGKEFTDEWMASMEDPLYKGDHT